MRAHSELIEGLFPDLQRKSELCVWPCFTIFVAYVMCVCGVCMRTCVCASVPISRTRGYKDPSVGESDHKPPEQLILSL